MRVEKVRTRKMAIDLEDDIIMRWISVRKLMWLLKKLPEHFYLFPNEVGNLLVVDSTNNKEIGYIDIAEEYFERFEDEEDL